MAYAPDEKLQETLLVNILMEKANMLKKHLKDTNSSLVICANIRPNVATFKLYNTIEEDSLKLCYTILNLGDLEDQLYQIIYLGNIILIKPKIYGINIYIFL